MSEEATGYIPTGNGIVDDAYIHALLCPLNQQIAYLSASFVRFEFEELEIDMVLCLGEVCSQVVDHVGTVGKYVRHRLHRGRIQSAE